MKKLKQSNLNLPVNRFYCDVNRDFEASSSEPNACVKLGAPAYLEQTGGQLLQLLLQLIPDLRQTFTLLVFKFQFLKCAGERETRHV